MYSATQSTFANIPTILIMSDHPAAVTLLRNSARPSLRTADSLGQRGSQMSNKSTVVLLIIGWLVLSSVLFALGGQEAALSPSPASPKHGGVLRVGTEPVDSLDPHFAATGSEILVLEQVYEHLTCLDAYNRPRPELAISWDSPDGREWTFTIRSDSVFNDGKPVTAADVVFSFNRLRDPQEGSPAVNLYRNIEKVTALDESRISFELSAPNPEFPSYVGDYRACIIPKDSLEPGKERVGSGAFMISAYTPQDGILLKPNPHFAGTDADGYPLPYLDEIRLVFHPDRAAQVEALRNGELDFVGGLNPRLAEILETEAGLRLITNDSNFHWVLHLRSDSGHLASDNRIRRALKLATDHNELIAAVRPGLASAGNGFSPVGPAYGEYYLDEAPASDPDGARALLAQAGYPDGLQITLHVQDCPTAVAIASVWKEQMARVGVETELEVIAPDIYFGEGERSWLAVDFGITEWEARITPATYFELAYTNDSQWNESHWSDPELDSLTRMIDGEPDRAKRVELYHRAQQIFIERGPIIVAFFEKAAVAINGNLEGVVLPAAWARIRFREVYFDN